MGIYEFISVIFLGIVAVIIAYLKFHTPPCRHEWEIIKSIPVYENSSDELPSYTRYHLRCKKCGEIIVKNMH